MFYEEFHSEAIVPFCFILIVFSFNSLRGSTGNQRVIIKTEPGLAPRTNKRKKNSGKYHTQLYSLINKLLLHFNCGYTEIYISTKKCDAVMDRLTF